MGPWYLLGPFILDSTWMSEKMEQFPDQIGQETHGIPFGGTGMEKNMDFRSHGIMRYRKVWFGWHAGEYLEIALERWMDIVLSKAMTVRLLGI